jgi:DNA-directed RNA polymerase subunit RPC12/RpoP
MGLQFIGGVDESLHPQPRWGRSRVRIPLRRLGGVWRSGQRVLTQSMKIIKSGEWKKKIVCYGCKAVMEIVAGDIQHEQVPQDDESFAEQFFIVCPECSHKIVQRNIPPKVQEQVLLA